MYYKPKYFSVKELVSPKTYEEEGESALRLLDSGLLKDLDIIRECADEPIIINDWSWGGNYKESGLRTKGDTYYSPTSGHALGKAFDIKLASWLKGDYSRDADWLRGLIMDLKDSGKLKYLTELEMLTDSWCHVGSRNQKPNHGKLFVFNP